MSCDDFWNLVALSRKGNWTPARCPGYNSRRKGKKKEERKKPVSPRNMRSSQSRYHPLPPSRSFTSDRENELEFRLQHIRLPASRVPLMRLDQGRSTGGFRAEGGLWCLYGGRSTSGQGCAMVGLHLVDQCLICVKPFPAADKQEDTSANSSSSKETGGEKESGGAKKVFVVGLSKMCHLLQ